MQQDVVERETTTEVEFRVNDAEGNQATFAHPADVVRWSLGREGVAIESIPLGDLPH